MLTTLVTSPLEWARISRYTAGAWYMLMEFTQKNVGIGKTYCFTDLGTRLRILNLKIP